MPEAFSTHQESLKRDHKYFGEDLEHLCFCQTLRKMVSTCDICWMKDIFLPIKAHHTEN